MLTEIYCEAFGSEKRIPFFMGLNVIQGFGSSEENRDGNSIGKTSMLKIIDYAFGGTYYADTNEDIIKHVGTHDICFAHKFGNTDFFFRRNAGSAKVVYQCADNKYEPQNEMKLQDFCQWFVRQYEIEDLGLTFREIVGLYSRVWNKPNKEVNRPLYNYNAQPTSEAIILLIKLFGEYASVGELYEQKLYLKKRQRIMSDAEHYHFFDVPTGKEAKQIKADLACLEEKITAIRSNLSVLAAENLTNQNQLYCDLYDRRALLSTQQSQTMRSLKRHKRDIEKLAPVTASAFSSLQEFFPEVNIKRLQDVAEFHNSLNSILRSELENEVSTLEARLKDIGTLIAENERAIQDATGIPTRTLDALDKLQQMLKQENQLQIRLELYEDKTADAAQRVDTDEKLDELMTQITQSIQANINARISKYSAEIKSSNRKAPVLWLTSKNYSYGVEDNTGTGKAYTDLILFDLAVLSLTQLPILIHDSFLLNNIDTSTIKSLLELYDRFPNKQVFVALDQFYGHDGKRIDDLLYRTTRLTISGRSPLYGKDWRTA